MTASEIMRCMADAMQRAGVVQEEYEPFAHYFVESMYRDYKKDRMSKRNAIENEVQNLGIRLPNGTVSKEYESRFTLPVEMVHDVALEGVAEIGLNFEMGEDGECRIHGYPTTAGDFKLVLSYGTITGEPRSEHQIPVAFNPNPRDLWRNIPTDPNIPYYKPDSATEYIHIEDADGNTTKDMVAASQRGRSHAQEGKARDDHFAMHHCDKSGWYVIAVADGAGSARYSRKGSEVACETAVAHCRAMLEDNPAFEQAIAEYTANREDTAARNALTAHVVDIVYRAATRAHGAVVKLADHDENSRIKDFNTTLMFAICKRYDFGWFIASFWVGDGALCLYDAESGTAKMLGTPDEGEYSGQTRFLTMREIFSAPDAISRRLRMTIVPDFTALFLMTDGVSDPMFETDHNLNDHNKWENFVVKLQEGFPDDEIPGVDLGERGPGVAEKLLKWLDLWSPGNHDDRTIAIMY